MKSREANLDALRKRLKTAASPERAKSSARFFKTGPGQYAEGDRFIGITVPELRRIAKEFTELADDDTWHLLSSPLHEERLLALYLLLQRFNKGSVLEQKRIYQGYLAHTKFINNWDLVDTSATVIVGGFLATQSTPFIRKTLLTLADSTLLWERRIAMIATFHWIKQGTADHALLIAKRLLNDQQDLMHKAVGWMLREVGKRCSQEILRTFLDEEYDRLPRTALRYAIEHFPEALRQRYLRRTKASLKINV